MNIRLQNQLNMIGASIGIAKSFKPVWENNEPSDFTPDFAALETGYEALKAKAALAAGASGGVA